jgi:hypothetical protein
MRTLPLLLAGGMLLTGCMARPKPHLTALPAAPRTSVAGTWCYRSAYDNVVPDEEDNEKRHKYFTDRYPNWHITRREGGFSALPLRDVYVFTPIVVERVADSVRITYRRRATQLTRTRTFAVKEEKDGVLTLRIPNRGGGVPLGIGWSGRSLDMTVGNDGRLAIIEHYQEGGLGLFIIPFREHLAWRMNLDPMSACAK